MEKNRTTAQTEKKEGISLPALILENEDPEEKLKQKPREKKGRRKIEIVFIDDKSRRHITFSKRKTGIMKKAYELATLTGTQVLLLVASETGHVYTFATPKLQPLITKPEGKNLIQACLNTPDVPQQTTASPSPSRQISARSNYGDSSPPPFPQRTTHPGDQPPLLVEEERKRSWESVEKVHNERSLKRFKSEIHSYPPKVSPPPSILHHSTNKFQTAPHPTPDSYHHYQSMNSVPVPFMPNNLSNMASLNYGYPLRYPSMSQNSPPQYHGLPPTMARQIHPSFSSGSRELEEDDNDDNDEDDEEQS
jgi:hypothetical protein